MGIGQSFWNGLLATPCGLYELGRYFLKWWFNKPLSYPQVPEIWTERSRLEVASYGFGQFVFLAWPALVGRLGCADSRVVFWCACVLAGCFAALTILTLFFPTGARRRYSWMGGPSPRTGYERLFLGQMQPDLLLSARGLGIRSCRRELLMYIFGSIAESMGRIGGSSGEFVGESVG
jgi:hypothetical protein